MRDGSSSPNDTPQGLLRSLVRTLTGRDMLKMAAYVALSLTGAFAGSLAAVLLVPLVQPGQPLKFAGGLFDVHGGIEVHSAFFAAAMAAFAISRWLAARLAARLTGRYGMTRRRLVHARLVEAPVTALADATSAEIANVLTYNVEIITQGFSAMLQLLVAGVTCIVSLGFALWVAPPLVFAAPLLAGLGLMASRSFGREHSQVSRRYVADMTRLFWLSEDFPRRLRHVRSFGREDAEKEGYGAISARLCRGYRRQHELVASGRLVLELLAAAGIATVFIVAWHWHGIDQSALIAVSLLLGRLLPYLVSTRQSFQQLRSAAPAFELWQRYMRLEPVHPTVRHASGTTAEGELRIERMRVTPPSSGLDVRELVLRPGELTLISGDSGIGKSSLVDVLAGMTIPEGFAARLGGRALGFEAYRELVHRGAYIDQSVRPWHNSVRECLLWAAPEASDEMLRSALADVGLERRLTQSGHGLDTAIHDASSRLSGGEVQRLMLAQVILRRPVLAVLDEATNALDPASEIAVLSALKRCLAHTILIVVSHRVDVAAIADQCLSIRDDQIAQTAGKGSLRCMAPISFQFDECS